MAQSVVELVEKERIVQSKGSQQGDYLPARLGQTFGVGDFVRTLKLSRGLLRLGDLTAVRLDVETDTRVIQQPDSAIAGVDIAVMKGRVFLLNRSRTTLRIRAPGGLEIADRGTEVAIRVEANGTTTVAVFEGEVEMHNAAGRLLLGANEQGTAELGKAPRKTAMIEAANIIQWCLYYPAVLDIHDLEFEPSETARLSASLEAYRAGDLLAALDKHPDKLVVRGSPSARVYQAAVVLAVGQVEQAVRILRTVSTGHPGRRALEKMIAAVKFVEYPESTPPAMASEWMAESYYEQSRSHLEAALAAAKKAAEISPEFGYAWARVAELEFSFGRTPRAQKQVERSLELSPLNAQAQALQGFFLAAENRIGAARRCFERAIELDGALGNAWLGRGLCSIRHGDDAAGRRDLQTAVTLEPLRSVLRSYLGKAFSQVGNNPKAQIELERAVELDPKDPTPWLYSAIQKKQENRYNEAIDDLERSIDLNKNRRLYRSRFLLDQDRSVRGTNLAAIYLNNGMIEQSVREAVQAVNSDYSSAPAHLFLANSYNALRDPDRVLLRYETAWFNELLLSNLLSPVGGGPLSQFVSEQEYSKLFERDGFGMNSVTSYLSNGELREIGSQYGTFGNFSYALDAEYQYWDGLRPNNEISRFEGYATFKFQLGSQDTLLFQTKFQDLRTGDVLQRYDPGEVGRETSSEVPGVDGRLHRKVTKNVAALTSNYRETQDPAIILAGWRHEWTPGNHTLLLAGRLASDQVFSARDTPRLIVTREIGRDFPPGLVIDQPPGDRPLSNGDLRAVLRERAGTGSVAELGYETFDQHYSGNFETYTAELSQILTFGPDSVIAGGRFQRGQFETRVRLDDFANGANPEIDHLFKNPPALQDATVDFERINLYLYNLWRITPWLSITGGVSYDSLRYPENFRSAPVSERQASLEKVSPKAGFTLLPWRGMTLRGAYAQAASGPSFDESIRLEPTQINGFPQAYRTVISESLIGSVGGSEYQFWGLSLEQKLPCRTYLGIEYNVLTQELDRVIGVFDSLSVVGNTRGIIPSSLNEKDIYREDVLTATVNQLVGDRWAFGARYRLTDSRFRQMHPGLADDLEQVPDTKFAGIVRESDRVRHSSLHEIGLSVLYNHPSGFFARAEANWFRQANDDLQRRALFIAGVPSGFSATERRVRVENLGRPGDDFWQFNLYAGYRFHRNQCELSVGALNLTGADYQLDPLNPYVELARDRTLLVRLKMAF